MHDLSLEEALIVTVSNRHIAFPNEGFVSQLMKWEKSEKRKTTAEALKREYPQGQSILDEDREIIDALLRPKPSEVPDPFGEQEIAAKRLRVHVKAILQSVRLLQSYPEWSRKHKRTKSRGNALRSGSGMSPKANILAEAEVLKAFLETQKGAPSFAEMSEKSITTMLALAKLTKRDIVGMKFTKDKTRALMKAVSAVRKKLKDEKKVKSRPVK